MAAALPTISAIGRTGAAGVALGATQGAYEGALRFCEEVELAAFAPAMGIAHGVCKGDPKISFERSKRIAERTGVPLALHGGTGLSDEVFRKCISLGCAKVNISTQLKYAFIEGFIEYHAEHRQYEPLKVIGAQFEWIKREMSDKMTLFGGAGKAAAMEV